MGFQHGAQTQANEVQRQATEQAQQATESAIDARQQKAEQNALALKSMTLATKAKEIADASHEKARNLNNTGFRTQGENVLNDLFIHASKWTDPASRMKISNAADMEDMERKAFAAKVTLAGVKPGPDGWLKSDDINNIVSTVPTVDPAYTQDYTDLVQGRLTLQKGKIDRENQLIAKGDGSPAKLDAAKQKLSALWGTLRDNANSAMTIYRQANNAIAGKKDDGTKDFQVASSARTKAGSDATKALAPFISKLSDANFVDDKVADIVKNGKEFYNNLSTGEDMNRWLLSLEARGGATSSLPQSAKDDINYTRNVISGSVAITPKETAISGFMSPDPPPADPPTQATDSDTEDPYK